MNKQRFLFAILFFVSWVLKSQVPPGMSAGIRPSDCTPAENYHFKGQMDMQMTTVKNGRDTSTSEFTGYFSDSGKMIAMVSARVTGTKSFTMTSIINMRDSLVVSLMDMGTVKFASCNHNTLKKDTSNGPKKKVDFKEFKATGKTKLICGYTCKEYFKSNEEGSMTLWLCETLTGLGNGSHSFSGNAGDADYPHGIKGVTMELYRIDAKSKAIFRMLVTKVDLNVVKVISTAGYKLR